MNNLLSFIESSPTAHHAVSGTAEMLMAEGFRELHPGDWGIEPGTAYFFRRSSGFLAAFRTGTAPLSEAGARITLAHSDSPALQIKVRGVSEKGNPRTLPVEVYGSPILSTWLDRTLEIAGTIAVRGSEGIELHPVRTGFPVGVIPNLAIHLNKKVNEGFAYEKHTHLRPILDEAFLGEDLLSSVAAAAQLETREVIEAELYLVPSQPPTPWGSDKEAFFTASRIDNLAGVWANIRGLIDAGGAPATQIAVLFDNEEVGSLTRSGAQSPRLSALLEEIAAMEHSKASVASRLDQGRSRSLVLSNDATHGSHPNFPEKQDPAYLPELGKGPVIKLSAVRRYATEPEATAKLRMVAEEAGVPLQLIQNRADIPAGTTVGPMSASSSLIPTADLGIPILAMHSARETAHLRDVTTMINLMRTFYESEAPGRVSRIH
jgi:aspartyl aminopeptidase